MTASRHNLRIWIAAAVWLLSSAAAALALIPPALEVPAPLTGPETRVWGFDFVDLEQRQCSEQVSRGPPSVAQEHTYFVGEMGVWVHNDCKTDLITYTPSHVKVTDLLVPETVEGQLGLLNLNERTISTSYLDGLGRPIQAVAQQGSISGTDVVTRTAYDDFGREARTYLPYVSSQNNGNFKTTAIEDQCEYYRGTSGVASDEVAYGETVFENSPLNRPRKQFGAGEVWKEQGLGISYEYAMNVLADGVKKFSVSTAHGRAVYAGDYAEVKLTKTITTDEAGSQVIEFVDRFGQTVLKRVQADELNSSNPWADTYYVYDGLGQLSFVLPPEAVKNISAYISAGATAQQDFLDTWVFQYQYDGRGRMIAKRVPGSGWTYMVYDRADRIVLIQDANQREKTTPEWTFTKYDRLSRPVLTGIFKDPQNRSREVLQQVSNNYSSTGPDIDWSSPLNISRDGGFIKKTTGGTAWNASAVSGEYLETGLDGQISVKATETGRLRMFGFTDNNITRSYTDLDFAYYLHTSGLIVYESGVSRGVKSTFATGDILTIERKGGQIFYKKNHEVVYTSTLTSTVSLQVDMSLYHQNATLQFVAANYEEKGDAVHGYTNQSFPFVSDPNDYLSVTYYDDYDFLSDTDFGSAYSYDASQLTGSISTPQGSYSFPSTALGEVKGQVTGVKTKVLDGADTWLNAVTYYDDRYRIIQTATENHRGGVDRTSSLYNFAGWVLKTKTSHAFPGKSELAIERRFEYDHTGRLLRGYHQVFKGGIGKGEVLLAENQYNGIGELIEKNLHVQSGTPFQSIDYRYNIRGWLESINNSELTIDVNNDDDNDLFGMELLYNSILNLDN